MMHSRGIDEIFTIVLLLGKIVKYDRRTTKI